MKTLSLTLSFVLVLLTLTACGKASRPKDEESIDLLEGQRKQMEKAEQVEEELQKALDERMKEVDGDL